MRTGIYRIRNKLNGKCYIGSAAYLRDGFSGRWSTHRHHLRRGSHHSAHLQSSWSKYGEDNFAFEILLYCTPEDCLIYEQIALDCYKPEYNTCAVAGSPLGYRHTERAKRAISRASKGRKQSKLARSRIGFANRGEGCGNAKLTEEDVREIRLRIQNGEKTSNHSQDIQDIPANDYKYQESPHMATYLTSVVIVFVANNVILAKIIT